MYYIINKKIIMNKRKSALITASSLIIMTIVAVFSIGFAYGEFSVSEKLDVIIRKNDLYIAMIGGIFIIIILDFIVAYTLYKFFEEDHKKIAVISGIIRAIYTVIFGIATYYLALNLYSNELTIEIADSNFNLFQTIWNSGLIVFGFHIILIGYLMKLHMKIPKILWNITLIAGVSYVILSTLKLGSLNSELVKTIELILALPMTIGELGLAIWLLIKGGK